MLTLRPARERGHANHGWLDSHHTFSFADYYDQEHMGYRSLRVINDDRVEGSKGFGTHPHRDMEIVTYVLDGELAHKDSMGNGSVIRPGDVQRMSAGTGITHSEMNPSKSQTHFLQIWIMPEKSGLVPSYEQKAFDLDKGLALVASRDGRGGSVTVHQDVSLYAGKLAPGAEAKCALAPGRHAWVQVARGAVDVNGLAMGEGDGAALVLEETIAIKAREKSEVLVFDLA
jgi:redox-sensitive bicupin YhaK (pirin superfamily)